MSEKSISGIRDHSATGIQPASFGRRKSTVDDAPTRREGDEPSAYTAPAADDDPHLSPPVPQAASSVSETQAAADVLPQTEGANIKIEELAQLAAGVGAEVDNSRRQGAADTGIVVTTTNSVEGHRISEYLGLVNGEAILGANLFKDMFASITDIVGGRSGAYEKELTKARGIAVQDMIDSAMFRDADAIVGVDIDYEVLSMRGSMLMVMASGTAVKLISID